MSFNQSIFQRATRVRLSSSYSDVTPDRQEKSPDFVLTIAKITPKHSRAGLGINLKQARDSGARRWVIDG